MMQISRVLLMAMAVSMSSVLPASQSPASQSPAAESLPEIAQRHCRTAGIGGRQLDECRRAIVTDAEQLTDASDERLRQALAVLRQGKIAEAEDRLLAFTKEDTAGAGPGRKDLALAYAALGALYGPGRAALAIDFYEKARALGPGDVTDTLHLAQIYDRQNDLTRAQALFQSVLDASRSDEEQDAFWRATALMGLGDIAKQRKNLAEADEHYKGALELFARLGRRYEEAGAAGSLGHLALQRGRLDEARKWLGRALSYYEEIGRKDAIAGTLINLGSAELRSGNYAVAEDHMKRALTIAQEAGNKQGQLAAHLNLGTISGRRGDFNDAESHNLMALKLAEELKISPLEAVISLKLAVMHDKRGNAAKACKWYGQAAARFAEHVPDERNLAKRLYQARCNKRQTNRLTPGAAASVRERAGDLPEFTFAIDEAGRTVTLEPVDGQ